MTDGSQKLWYLDLRPETVKSGPVEYTRKALKYWGPKSCFCSDNLYQLRIGETTTDGIETKFFGPVDRQGAAAVGHFRNFTGFADGTGDAFNDLLAYLGAQRVRTPRDIARLQRRVKLNRNDALAAITMLFQVFTTMWSESIWEIVHARTCDAKFIISDNPVTFFNKRAIPGGLPSADGNEFSRIGTRTIFPLGPDSCLILTHTQLARDPWSNPDRSRENWRSFAPTLMNLTEIQFGRELDEDEVLRINRILKRSADRFIASPDKEALYPERRLPFRSWTELDSDWFLLPNPWKVPFTTGIVVGYKDGSVWGMDEYGRQPWHPRFENQEQRDWERRRFEDGKREWARRRFGKSLAQVDDHTRHNVVADLMMNDFLRESGFAPKEADDPAS